MARIIPLNFYLNILAGIIVLFNYYASSKTGDIALYKVTDAPGRIYTAFRDTVHGYAARLETALCGPVVESVLPCNAAEYIQVRYQDQVPEHLEGAGGVPA